MRRETATAVSNPFSSVLIGGNSLGRSTALILLLQIGQYFLLILQGSLVGRCLGSLSCLFRQLCQILIESRKGGSQDGIPSIGSIHEGFHRSFGCLILESSQCFFLFIGAILLLFRISSSDIVILRSGRIGDKSKITLFGGIQFVLLVPDLLEGILLVV